MLETAYPRRAMTVGLPTRTHRAADPATVLTHTFPAEAEAAEAEAAEAGVA
ncbi:hypothetical protein [Nonomuraea sp. NPDC046570]|uniref:hypothetical protein n=1 Tax=Nonomuraea sp. NPDC046570 TaxID=3155255 RepID=UPI0033EC6B8D